MVNNRFIARINSLGITIPPVDPPDPPDPVDPPDPPNPEFPLGWAGVYNGGAGVTGGNGGTVRTFTNYEALLEAIHITDESEPEIFRYTGSNTTIEDIRWELNNPKENKTIENSVGQTITNGEIKPTGWENLIVRNIKRTGPSLVHEDFNGGDSSKNRSAFRFNSCTGVWVHHVEVDGGGIYGGVSGSSNKYWDGCIDMNISNFVTISDSSFYNADRGILIGYGDSDSQDDLNENKLNVTIRDCILNDIRQRGPRTRWGKIHILNCNMEWVPVWGTSGLNRPGTVRFIQVGTKAQVICDSNWFDNGQSLITDADQKTTKLSGILLRNNYIGSFTGGTSQFRHTNVEWRPETTTHYEYTEKTPAESKAYTEMWAGAKFHLKSIVV